MELSILIPAIPERLDKLGALCNKLDEQIGDRKDQVEYVFVGDNKNRSIGAKRNNCKSLVLGRYFAFCDDDDDIAPNYINSVLQGVIFNPDVITFKQVATVNDIDYEIRFHIENKENGDLIDPAQVVERPPWHVCFWKTEKFQQYMFGDSSYGEDWAFCEQAIPHIASGYHIEEVLHFYRHDEELSAAYLDEESNN